MLLGLALAGVEPVATFYYPCAWIPALLVADALAVRRRGRSLLTHRPLALLCLLCWSVPFWLAFEALNLRLECWYYVNAPASPVAARLLLLVSFATVLPAIAILADLLAAYGAFERWRFTPLRASPRFRAAMVALGVACLVLPLARPAWFHPLVWAFPLLVLEPWNRRPGWNSLLRDLERGRPARLLRLVVAGGACGLFWEFMNVPARARWIYSVPFLDASLPVEMPLLGFLGFLPFALSAYSTVRALEIAGLSVPFEADAKHALPPVRPIAAPVRLLLVPGLVALGSLWTIHRVEERTVDSIAAEVADPTLARLAALRGIGAANARLLARVGVADASALALRDPEELYRALAALGPDAARVRPRRVAVWVRGARAVERDRREAGLPAAPR